jgi:hypothetical protein
VGGIHRQDLADFLRQSSQSTHAAGERLPRAIGNFRIPRAAKLPGIPCHPSEIEGTL